jgi:hypothetical protein
MSKNELLDAIRAVGSKLGRVPTVQDMEAARGITRAEIRKHFASLRQAFRAAGLDPSLDRSHITTKAMLEDWGEVARKMGRVPSSKHYDLCSKYSKASYYARFGAWSHVRAQFRQFMEQAGATERDKWKDVLELIEKQGEATKQEVAAGKRSSEPQAGVYTRRRCAIFPERPLLGAPLRLPGLSYEPMNEIGVIFLFGIVAHQLGFQVEHLNAAFPDCEAVRELQPGKWQRVKIEIEYESRNFLRHGHPANGCDVIVCWRHNWPECPGNLEVVELRREIKVFRLPTSPELPKLAE